TATLSWVSHLFPSSLPPLLFPFHRTESNRRWHHRLQLQVYCQSHVPKTGPGRLDGHSVGIKAALNVPKKSQPVNEQIRVSGSKPVLGTDALVIKQALSSGDQTSHAKPPQHPAGHFD